MSNQPEVDSWDGVGQLPLLFSKTAAGAYNYWQCWVQGDHVWVRWGQIGTESPQVASFKCEPKNAGRANATTAEQQAIREAIAKWKKQVKKKYHWDQDHWETARNLKPMLAKELKKHKKPIEYPVWVQPKYDGVRCLAFQAPKDDDEPSVQLRSRGGDPYLVQHIREQLSDMPSNVILDGELYHHGTPLQTIVSWVKDYRPESAGLTYVIYDVFDEENPHAPWAERYAFLQHLFGSLWALKEQPHIFEAQTAQVHSRDEIKYYHDQFVELGFEGAIVRLGDTEYRFGYRSSGLLKLKEFEDDEFEVVGWKVGKGKMVNCPIFECVSPRAVDQNDRTFDVVPKGTEEQRYAMLQQADSYIGKQMTVRYFNYTPDGKPFHPTGICIREPGT